MQRRQCWVCGGLGGEKYEKYPGLAMCEFERRRLTIFGARNCDEVDGSTMQMNQNLQSF